MSDKKPKPGIGCQLERVRSIFCCLQKWEHGMFSCCGETLTLQSPFSNPSGGDQAWLYPWQGDGAQWGRKPRLPGPARAPAKPRCHRGTMRELLR